MTTVLIRHLLPPTFIRRRRDRPRKLHLESQLVHRTDDSLRPAKPLPTSSDTAGTPFIMLRPTSATAKLPLLISLTKLVSASPVLLTQYITAASEKGHKKGGVIHPEDPPDSPAFFLKLGVSAVLVLLGGVFAGYVR
jgi:hypothetical protein